MKKKYIIIISIIIFLLIDSILLFLTFNKKENNKQSIHNTKTILNETNQNNNDTLNQDDVDLKIDKLIYEYDSRILLKDIIESDIDGYLNTEKLGKQTINITDKNNKTYQIDYEVVDTTPPLILGGTTKSTTEGTKINLVNKYMCGDNHDSKPKCYIEGEYDINKVGTYSLKYIAEDSSGNKSSKNIKLKVKEKKNTSSSSSSSSSSGSSSVKRTKLSSYIKTYKKDNTKIGIDVSAWQDNIDWKKAKKDGVEFAMLRIGYGHTSKNEIVLDKWFENNIKKTKENKIPIGVYLYSYAKTKNEAIEQAQWIIKKLNGQKLDLPIAFDWENWNSFNKYGVSFKELSDIADAFINEVEKAGYKGMLYSSAYYLNHIWRNFDNTWLAYYTKNNDYKKDYIMWQLSSKGEVKGISGSVDIDILYNKKNEH